MLCMAAVEVFITLDMICSGRRMQTETDEFKKAAALTFVWDQVAFGWEQVWTSGRAQVIRFPPAAAGEPDPTQAHLMT